LNRWTTTTLDAVVEEFTASAAPVRRRNLRVAARYADRRAIERTAADDRGDPKRVVVDPSLIQELRQRPGRLGDYRIVREIGRGGMGVVYEAVQESLGRTVALKVLLQQMLADPKRVERFEQEARIAARLHHTNIVPVFGVGFDEGLHYYVMQRIQGEGWDRRLLHSATKPTAQEAARIGRDAARALQQAHDEGTLHRDVKPGNILIDDQEHVWLTDFGLAQILESDVTATAHVAGTLRYLPPERLHGVSDARGDVYSLGVALFEAVGGR
jgi:serine/threonine protein kinase